MQLYRRGHRGPAVAQVRAALATLALLPDADAATAFGNAVFDDACDRAVRAFQQRRGLSVDGIVGPETFRALEEARWRLGDRVLSYRVARPFVGDDVAALQERLLELGFDAGRCDGIFGAQTATALRELQRNYGLVPDGTCGPATLRALRQLGRKVVGGRPHLLREDEALARSGPALIGKTVVVDPGHGGADRGAVAGGLQESAVVADLAARVEGRLVAVGVTAYLTRGLTTAMTDAQRADFANNADADLVLSLHCDASPSPRCHGVATYYYGTYRPGGATSTVGERLAGLVQREVVARTDLLDCGTHGTSWELLRRTRMPTVRLELGYLTNPGDAARLAAAEFRDTVAEAVLAAVQRLYLPPELDQPTGVLRLPALAPG